MELALEVLSRPALFSLVGTCLSLADLFKLRNASMSLRGILSSQSDSFWRVVIKTSLGYRPYMRDHPREIIERDGLDAHKRNGFRRTLSSLLHSSTSYCYTDHQHHIDGLYQSCSGFVYAHHQFPQLYELDVETLRPVGEVNSIGSSNPPRQIQVDMAPSFVPWHLLAWDLMFLDEMVRSHALNENGRSIIHKNLIHHACIFRRESGTSVTVEEAARQGGLGVLLRHHLIVFRLEELIKGYEICQARAEGWTPNGSIRHPMETQPFNFALPSFQRIGDAANTLAFSTVEYRLPKVDFTLNVPWNVMFMLRVSPWTGNWIGVFCPVSVYAVGRGLTKALPPMMEEALSSAPVHEYHAAEQWLRMKNMTDGGFPWFMSP